MSHAIREALAAVRRTPLLTLLSALLVALALFVLGLFGLSAWNLRQAVETLEARVEVVAYIRDDATAAQITLLMEELRRLPEVEDAQFISREEALRRARVELPEFADLFAEIEVNPLPASVEITLLPGMRTEEGVGRVAEEASSMGIVEEVAYGEEWVERLFALRRVAGITAAILGAGFASVAVVIIGTAIRIAIFARREEILIMRLVGARDGFIRRPFLIEGAMTGLAGGVAALGLTRLAHQTFSTLLFPVDWIPAVWTLSGVAAGTVLGTVAGWLAVQRYLRQV